MSFVCMLNVHARHWWRGGIICFSRHTGSRDGRSHDLEGLTGVLVCSPYGRREGHQIELIIANRNMTCTLLWRFRKITSPSSDENEPIATGSRQWHGKQAAIPTVSIAYLSRQVPKMPAVFPAAYWHMVQPALHRQASVGARAFAAPPTIFLLLQTNGAAQKRL